jgi:hypothetical protein
MSRILDSIRKASRRANTGIELTLGGGGLAIVLPGQSLNIDKSRLATNSRNQTVAGLTTQLKHYSASTRRG